MKTLDEMIAVMEASKTKTIQCLRRWRKGDADWEDCYPVPDGCGYPFDWSTFDYRVKPEIRQPIRIYCMTDDSGNWNAITTDTRIPIGEFIELTPEVKAKLGLKC